MHACTCVNYCAALCLDRGPGVDSIVVQGRDGQHHVGKGVAEGTPSKHVDQGCYIGECMLVQRWKPYRHSIMKVKDPRKQKYKYIISTSEQKKSNKRRKLF